MKTRELKTKQKTIHSTRARTLKESVCVCICNVRSVAMRTAIVCGIQWRRQLNGNKIYSRVRLRPAFCCLRTALAVYYRYFAYVLASLDDASSIFKVLFPIFLVFFVVVIEEDLPDFD